MYELCVGDPGISKKSKEKAPNKSIQKKERKKEVVSKIENRRAHQRIKAQ